jgi:multidrug efflux pump subunit AcrA (membrane-fusion protein)
MRFEGAVSADRLGELKLGQSVNFRINGINEPAEFQGTLQRIDAAANAVTRQVEVVVAFADPTQAPQVAGLFAEGRVDSGAHSALVIAEGSVVRQGDNTQVWKLANGKLVKTTVKLGDRDSRRGVIEVKSGLALGDQVLRAPTSTLVDGQAFQRVAAGAGAASAVAAK